MWRQPTSGERSDLQRRLGEELEELVRPMCNSRGKENKAEAHVWASAWERCDSRRCVARLWARSWPWPVPASCVPPPPVCPCRTVASWGCPGGTFHRTSTWSECPITPMNIYRTTRSIKPSCFKEQTQRKFIHDRCDIFLSRFSIFQRNKW